MKQEIEEMMEWQWHQKDHMQIICTSLHTDNHASTSPLSDNRKSCMAYQMVRLPMTLIEDEGHLLF